MIDTTRRRIFRYLLSERIHPSLLLTGPNRAEKFKVAIEMAQLLFCSDKTDQGPCGRCRDCTRVTRNSHPDLLIFGVAAEGETDEDAIKIESVRELTHHMELSSHEGKAKVCIVDEAHRMNSAAQNAFLKTLEEPGQGRYFFLLSTQPGKLLSTVLSRCLEFSFKPDPQGRFLTQEEMDKYRKLFSEGLRAEGFADLGDELVEKNDVLQFIRMLQTEMREKTVEGKPVHGFHQFTDHEMTRIFDHLIELEGRMRSNANPNLMLEQFMTKQFVES